MRFRGQGGVDGVDEDEDEDEGVDGKDGVDVKDGRKKVVQFGEID